MRGKHVGSLAVVESETTRRHLGVLTDRDAVVAMKADPSSLTMRDAMTPAASGVLASAVAGGLCGFGWWIGAGFGALSLLGDAFSSAVKRRLRRPPGSDAPLLDQLPEALLPMLVLGPRLSLGALQVAVVVALFLALDLLCTRRWFAAPWNLRRRHL